MSTLKNKSSISLSVSCLPNCEKEVKKLFWAILDDYCNRFNTKLGKEKVRVQICLVEYEHDGGSAGVTSYSESEGRILIQLRDPFLSDWEPNMYMMDRFICILCHEIIHACQYLTGRKGFRIPKAKWDRANDKERYFFDPVEVEARALEGLYASLYGHYVL